MSAKAIAIIPARGGSKGLPGKNLCQVNWISLVGHAVMTGLEAVSVGDVLVSSDDELVLKEARGHKATHLIRRPAELATDWASTDDVLLHALKTHKKAGNKLPMYTVLLQPTSPLRDGKLVDRCVREAEEKCADSVFTAYDAHFAWRRVGDEPLLVNGPMMDRKPRQLMTDSERVMVENGAVYVTKTAKLLKTGNRLTGKIAIVEMPKEDSIDIDTEYDLWLADKRMKWLEEARHLEGRKVV